MAERADAAPRSHPAAEGHVSTDRVNGQVSRSTVRSLTVLEALVMSQDALTLTAVAQQVSMPVASCAAVLNALERRGYASRTIVGRSHFWQPTLRLYSLGMRVMRHSNLGPRAQPHLRWLSDRLGAPAHLGILEDASVVYVAKAANAGMVQFNTYPGKVAAFNLTALGRAVVAFLPEQEQEELVHRAVRGSGPKARSGFGEELRDQLREIRGQGYATEDEEEELGIGCLAAPVLGAQGIPVAAVGATGFVGDLLHERRDQVAEAVVEAARRVSVAFGFR